MGGGRKTEGGAGKLNTGYKDSVFTKLFGEKKERLLGLYGALCDRIYGPETEIAVNTLRDALFMDKLNDLSFTVEGRVVVLVEHQSTINRNMPLRFLLYIARIYEKIVDSRTTYRSRLREIPKPEFVVLYNGTARMAEREEMKLADAFAGLEEGMLPELDLKVKVYNINKGYNKKIVGRSRDLADYVEFVALARENERAGLPRREAAAKAVRDCVVRGVMEEFLREHGSEVVNMLLSEWKLEDAQKIWREEGVEEGIERKAIEDARAMFVEGIGIDAISRITRLPVDKLKEML